MAASIKKGLGANQARHGTVTRRASNNLQHHYITVLSFAQASNLLDLAQHEADQAAEAYQQALELADQRRRRYFRAVDNLREVQAAIPTTGGQAQ